MRSTTIGVVLVFVLVVALGIIYWSDVRIFGIRSGLWGDGVIASSTISGVVVDAESIANASPPPEGTIQYINERFGFSFYHFPGGRITEHDEGGGAVTIVLENENRVRGLQVFIVPYGEDKITDARFHADVPSGIRENIENTTLGLKKIPAVTFTSVDETLGETREIWFIKDGYLFEVTTFKGVGNWFEPIIQSWRFES